MVTDSKIYRKTEIFIRKFSSFIELKKETKWIKI